MASREELARSLMGMTPAFPVVAPGIGSPLAVPNEPRAYSYKGQPVGSAVRGIFGLDPGMQRGAILPVGRQPGGDTEFAAPQWLYEIAKALVAPSHAYRGGTVTDEDALNFGLTVAGGGGAVGTAMAPRGALAAGGARSARSLPMDEASRMARARQMGFDTDTPLYHGTNRDFSAFQRRGESHDTGIYLTTDPEYASGYASVFGNELREGAQVIPAYASLKNPAYFLTKPTDIELGLGNRGAFTNDVIRKLQEEGHDGVIVGVLKHELDDGIRTMADADEVVAFDPRQVRSRFAKFDPAKSESADLLAANASPYLSLIYALMGESDAGTAPQ